MTGRSDRAYAMAFLGAAVLYLAAWLPTRDAGLGYDEATYADIADHPLHTAYYPDPVFHRHPPLPFLLMSVWPLAARAWPVAWSIAGLALLTLALRSARQPPALALTPVLALPALLGLLAFTMYPPLFALLALAAWGRAANHRPAELAGWNLAALCHELVVVALAFHLAPAAWALARTRTLEIRRWTGLVLPYAGAGIAAAWVLWGVVAGPDPRAGSVFEDFLGPTDLEILAQKPLQSLAAGLALAVPLLHGGWRSRPGQPHARAAAAFALFLVIASPFYRYLLVALPQLVTSTDASGWRRQHTAALLATAVASSGAAWWFIDTGADTVNDSDVPGLADYERAATLAPTNGTVALRSPPALAHALRADGWQVVETGPGGPDLLALERGAERVRLVLVRTQGEATRVAADWALLPATWEDAAAELRDLGWRRVGERGGLVLLAAPVPGADATTGP